MYTLEDMDWAFFKGVEFQLNRSKGNLTVPFSDSMADRFPKTFRISDHEKEPISFIITKNQTVNEVKNRMIALIGFDIRNCYPGGPNLQIFRVSNYRKSYMNLGLGEKIPLLKFVVEFGYIERAKTKVAQWWTFELNTNGIHKPFVDFSGLNPDPCPFLFFEQ